MRTGNPQSSWTNLTSFHLDLVRVIQLPAMQELQPGQRFVILFLYNCDLGKSRIAKRVEDFVCLSGIHHAL